MGNFTNFFKNKEIINYLEKNAEHYFKTYAYSQVDELTRIDKRLLNLCIEIVSNTDNIKLDTISERFPNHLQRYMNTWPGEHYKLLSSIVKIIKPQLIIEIGTATGASCLSMKESFSDNRQKIITYDIVPWDQCPGSGFFQSDFGEQLEQRIVNLSDNNNFKNEVDFFLNADLIFLDAAKDGIFEYNILQYLSEISFKKHPIIILDDIRFMNMIPLWRSIEKPKIDITSFGHWSGTGLVNWVDKPEVQ